MRPRALRQARAPVGEDEAPLQDVQDQREDQRRRAERERPAVEQPPEGQAEHEEAQVAPEERVDGAERHLVPVGEDRLPVGARPHAGHERHDQEHQRQRAADQRLDHDATRQPELVLELPEHVRRRRPRREG